MKKVICLLVIAFLSLSFAQPKELTIKLTLEEWNKVIFVLRKYPMANEESQPIIEKIFQQATEQLKDSTKKK